MGKGRWKGDGSGGNGFRGHITSLTIDGEGKVEFDHAYAKGATGNGHFEGDWTIESDV